MTDTLWEKKRKMDLGGEETGNIPERDRAAVELGKASTVHSGL